MMRRPYRRNSGLVRQSGGSEWLVLLRSSDLIRWIERNRPDLRGYNQPYASWGEYGFDAPLVDRNFTVRAASEMEAAQKGLDEFNRAAAPDYEPLPLSAVESVDRGPVYMARCVRRETGDTSYTPFTRETAERNIKAELGLRGGGSVDEHEITASAYDRSPASLGRSFVPGTAEHEAYLDYLGAMEGAMAEEMEQDLADATDNLQSVMSRQTGLALMGREAAYALMDVDSRQAEQEYIKGAVGWTDDMIEAFVDGKQQAFIDAQIARNAASRRMEVGDVRFSGMSGHVKSVGQSRLLSNRGRRRHR